MTGILEIMAGSELRGVRGVLPLDSGRPGPIVAILVCTHGNEPAGLHAIDYLLGDLRLRCGQLWFVLTNIDAARQQRRYIDFNLNRVPEELRSWDGSVEGARLQELLPLLQAVDGGVLDLHSTSADAPPMLLANDAASVQAAQQPHVPFEHFITGIAAHLDGKFLVESCTQAPLKLLAECGQHQCPEAASRAAAMCLSFLTHLGIWENTAPLPQQPKTITHYRVKQALHLPPECEGSRLIQPIQPFEWLEAGRNIACNGKHQFTVPESGYAIMCPKTQDVLDTQEALLFMCEKQ